MNKYKEVKKMAVAGYDVWHRLKTENNFIHTDFIIFYELDNVEIRKLLSEIIEEMIGERVFVVTTMNGVDFPAEKNICITQEEYAGLKKFYEIGIFHPRIRFISEEEPFGNLRIYENVNNKKEYVKKALLRIRR